MNAIEIAKAFATEKGIPVIKWGEWSDSLQVTLALTEPCGKGYENDCYSWAFVIPAAMGDSKTRGRNHLAQFPVELIDKGGCHNGFMNEDPTQAMEHYFNGAIRSLNHWKNKDLKEANIGLVKC